jgi:hypothetical protein
LGRNHGVEFNCRLPMKIEEFPYHSQWYENA